MKIMFKVNILHFLSVTFLFIWSCEPLNRPLDVTIAERNHYLITNIFLDSVHSHNIPGAILFVKFKDGSHFKEAIGYSNISDSSKMETNNQFRIGSVTKTMIGTGILLLVQKDIIQLDNTIEELLPGLLSYGNIITLEMLLNHSSAIPDYTSYDSFLDIYSTDPTYEWTPDMICNLFKDEELIDTPGKKSYYSNSNYYLLGLIIERYSNKSLSNFLHYEIFLPLGMYNTYLPTMNNLQGNYSHGYLDLNQDGNFSVDEDFTSQNPYSIWAAGGVVSTVDDLLIWIDELIAGSLLNEEIQNRRLEIKVPVNGAPEGVYYGLGISDIFGAVGHTGAVAGYSTILFNYKNTTFIAFGNGYETVNNDGLIAEVLFEKLKTALFN